MKVLAVTCKQFSGTFTFLGSSAGLQAICDNTTFKAAKRLGNMTG